MFKRFLLLGCVVLLIVCFYGCKKSSEAEKAPELTPVEETTEEETIVEEIDTTEELAPVEDTTGEVVPEE